MRRSMTRRRRVRRSLKALDRDAVATAYGKARTAHRLLTQGFETYEQAIELLQGMRSNDPGVHKLINHMRITASGLYPSIRAVRDTMRRLGVY